MKKLLIVLMVVAVSSFLFVGCLGVTPPADDVDDDDDVDDVLASATPVLTGVASSAVVPVAIVDLTSTATQYVNKAEAGTLIFVQGTAPAESLVSIYLDDVAITAAVGETSVNGLWSIFVAKSALGDDGVKVITAKCTEVGLTESVASNAATFTLDTVLPSATTLAATADAAAGATGGTAVSDVLGTAIVSATVPAANTDDIVTGTWVIKILGISGATNNVSFALDGGTPTIYTGVSGSHIFALGAPIPGVRVLLPVVPTPGQQSTITCLAESAAIVDRARVLFSEEITNASAILLANYVFSTAAVVNVPTAVLYADPYMYFSPMVTAVLASGNTLSCSVNGVEDLAGNIQTTASVITCVVSAAHATTLAP